MLLGKITPRKSRYPCAVQPKRSQIYIHKSNTIIKEINFRRKYRKRLMQKVERKEKTLKQSAGIVFVNVQKRLKV